MGRLSKLRVVDPVLTNLAIGYTNEELVGSVLMPFVDVDKEAGKIPRFSKEAFKLYHTERALRARSNRINPEDGDDVDVVLDEHDPLKERARSLQGDMPNAVNDIPVMHQAIQGPERGAGGDPRHDRQLRQGRQTGQGTDHP